MWDLIVSVPDHCLPFFFTVTYISWSSDFVLYLEEYLMHVHCTLGL